MWHQPHPSPTACGLPACNLYVSPNSFLSPNTIFCHWALLPIGTISLSVSLTIVLRIVPSLPFPKDSMSCLLNWAFFLPCHWISSFRYTSNPMSQPLPVFHLNTVIKGIRSNHNRTKMLYFFVWKTQNLNLAAFCSSVVLKWFSSDGSKEIELKSCPFEIKILYPLVQRLTSSRSLAVKFLRARGSPKNFLTSHALPTDSCRSWVGCEVFVLYRHTSFYWDSLYCASQVLCFLQTESKTFCQQKD